MRVLFIAREFPPFVVGGTGIHTSFLVKHLRSIGVTCEVISFGDPSASANGVEFLRPSSSILRKEPGELGQDVRILADVREMTLVANRRAEEGNYDIVHVEEPYVGALVRHKRKVTTIHDTSYGEFKALIRRPSSVQDLKRMVFYLTFGPAFEFFSAWTSKMVITPADHIRRELVEIYAIRRGKIRTIRNGIEPPAEVNKPEAKQSLGMAPSTTLVFTSAQHVARKRLETLVQAVARMNIQGGNVKVVIGGSGPQRPGLMGLARSLGVDGVIAFPGWLTDETLALYYEASDIFVLTSEYEAGPITLLEAMSYGDAAVSSRIEGFPKLMSDGKDGVLFKVGNPDDLALKLSGLIQDPDRIRALSHASREFVKRFGWDEVARETMSAYEDLCNRVA
jgi:glycosyltransferase involved in cell wall biosynthesis